MTSQDLFEMDASGNRENLGEEDNSGDRTEGSSSFICSNEKKRKLNNRDNKDTNNFETLLDKSEDNIFHIILSKSFRSQLVLELKFLVPLSDDKIISRVSNNLQESDESILFYIAGFDRLESRVEKDNDHNNVYYEKCLFIIFCIPKQLIEKLLENNIYKAYFYIGNYDEKQKFLIMNRPPDYDKLSDKSDIGVSIPYQSSLLTFEKR